MSTNFGVKTMLKIFGRKIIPSRVTIASNISSPHKEYLMEAKGTINNYLRDKKCKVVIKNCPLSDGDSLEVSALNNSKDTISRVSVIKDSDTPFLRKIYQAIELVTKQVINKS